jgi:hypothetical protein
MSGIQEVGMEDASARRSGARSDEPEARSGVPGTDVEIGGVSPVLEP